jgi:hypothetical protein
MAEKREIKMEDGTTVAFNAKQKLVKTSTISDKGEVSLRMDFENGAVRSFVIPADMVTRFAAHGAEQKLGDNIAGEKDIDDAVVSTEDLIARLNTGEWNVARAAGGFSGASVLIQALVEASGKTIEDIKAYLSNKTQAEKLALRRSDKLAPIVTRIESEKASKSKSTIDTGALFDELAALDKPSKKSAE